MPIGSTNVYNAGDLILSTVSGSGTSFIETKIAAATSSLILFNSSATLTSQSLNSTTVGTSSYVSGSTSIITNLTASNISASGKIQANQITASSILANNGPLMVTGSNAYIQMFPVGGFPLPTNLTASYIYTSGSTNDMYFTQYSGPYTNTTRLRWLESNLYTGILHGGVLTSTPGSTTFTVTEGEGLIVSLNAFTASAPYPTVKLIQWPTSTQPIIYSGSANITYVGIDNVGSIVQQTNAWGSSDINQWDNQIELGVVLHLSGSVSNGVFNSPQISYGIPQQTDDFFRAFGPLKISGHTLQASGSTPTLSIKKSGGIAYREGANYVNNPNHPSTVTEGDANISKIYRYYISGSTPIIDTGIANAGYTTIDNDNYVNTATGQLATVGNSNWTIQRVFWIPNSPTNAFIVYYGNATYSTLLNAVNAKDSEPFTESPNTSLNAIFVGYIIIEGGAGRDLLNAAECTIIQGGLFRNVGGIGSSGTSPVSTTLAGLSDVALAGLAEGDLLVYGGGQWNNKKTLIGNYTVSGSLSVTSGITGNLTGTSSWATNAVTSSFALTASYVSGSTSIITNLTASNISASGTITANSFTGSFSGSITNAVTAISASFSTNSLTASCLTPANSYTITNLTASNISASATGSFGIVGIGTSSPGYKLDVYTSDQTIARFAGTNSRQIVRFGNTAATQYIDLIMSVDNGQGEIIRNGSANSSYGGASSLNIWNSNGPIAFHPNNTANAMFLSSAGNLGIGTTSPTARLHVSGSTGGVFEVDTAGGSTTFYVSASGNVGIGTTNPSYRLTIQNNAASTNALLALQNLTASATTNHGVGILPILSDNTGSTDITAGGLYWLKEQQWTNDTTSRDSYLRIDTTENGLASEKVRITSAGNVGIGTTSPRSGLQVNTVNGAAANEYAGLIVSSNLSSSRGVNIAYDATNDAGIITAVHAGTGWKPLALQPVNGNVGIGTTNPTARLHVSSSTGGVFEVDTAGGATTFYVSASGNVGIGTITPNGKLHIVSPDSTYAFSVAGATKGVRFNINSAGTYIQGVDNTLAGSYQSLILGGSDLYFQTNGLTTAMYISSSGNVGIGTSSPTNKLHVVGEIASYKNGSDAIQSQLYLANTGNTQAYNFQLNSAGTSLDLWGYDNANGWKNNVTFGKSGNVGIGTSTSILGKLQLNSDVAPYYGPVTSSATPNGIFVLGSLSGDVVNTFGVDASATAYAWIQPRKTTVASYSNLVLNPNGGNVGIGTTLPASKFHISGSGQTIMRLDSDTTTNVSQFQIKAASDAVLIMGMLGGSAASTNFGVTAAGQAYFGTTTLGSPHPTSLVIGNASNIPIIFSTNNIERMRIDSVGNVGIGTTSANNKLEVIGGTNTRINLGNIDDANRGGKLEIISGSVTARQFYVGTNSAIYNLVFGIDSVEKMRIDTNGNVGIGVTAPLGRLHITGSSTASETLLYLSKGSGSITQNYINAVDQSGASNYRVTSDINGYAQQVLFRSGTSYVNHDAYWSSWINNANYTQGGLALGTGSLTHGYALNISRPATSGSLYVSGSSIFTGSVSVSGSVTFSGPIIYDNAVLLDYGSTSTPVVSTNYAVLQNLTGSYNSAFFDYFASSGSNFRAGTVIAGWSGSSVNYTEYSTTDVGNTNQLSMSVDLSGSFVRLLTRVSTTINWNIKSAGRYL